MTCFDGVVIITGGATGLGAASARAFCNAGATVTIFDVRDGEDYARDLTITTRGSCSFRRVDVSSSADLIAAVHDVADRHGGLDCLLNNAAVFTGWKTIDEISAREFQTLWEVNALAVFIGAQAALPYLRRRRGSIVNMTSIAAEIGSWRDSAYSATKGAVSAFTKALAVEEAANGVRVNAVAPGIANAARALGNIADEAQREAFGSWLQNLQWMGRSGTAEEVASACLFLASEAASFVTGAILNVTGGLELGLGTKLPYPGVVWT